MRVLWQCKVLRAEVMFVTTQYENIHPSKKEINKAVTPTLQLTSWRKNPKEGSSPQTQQLATCPYSEPVESSPNHPVTLPKIHYDPILQPAPWSFE
jgi:hypothetical protein